MSVVARLLGEREHRLPGLRVVDRELAVPLDHARPEVGEPLQLFAREVVAASKAREDLPVLVYLQGGPGGKCPRPARRDSWLERACQDYRVLLLDQRGTGQSSPATAQTVTALGPPAAQAEYLSHFRADAIVEDAEAVRRALLGPATRWSLLGQSFGGFCVLRYLSAAPEGVREAFITGGVPSLDATATDIYRASYPRVANKNAAYFARYPEDRARLAEVITSIGDGAGLPGGGRLSVRRLLCLGLAFGMSDGFEAVHYLLAEAFVRVGGRHQLADGFLHAAAARLSRVQDPLFAVLHEAIYCQGRSSGWAAEAVRAELPEFAVDAPEPIFTGEMIYPWWFEEDPALVPLAEAADLLASREDWPALYDTATLAGNDVPVAAVAYGDDMYVDRDMSQRTAASVGAMRLWVTNEYEHDGLARDGTRILSRLFGLVRGEA